MVESAGSNLALNRPSGLASEYLLAADRRALFRIVHEGFLEAEALTGGPVAQCFDIGGHVVKLRFAGGALVAIITRALAHLRTSADAAPDLTVCLWDSASTGRPLPLLAASLLRLLRITWLEDRGVRGEILDYNDSGLSAALEGHKTDVLSLLDLAQNLGVFWTPDWSALPWYEAGAPLRTLLSWWFARQGWLTLHGGAVGLPTGGLLLAGGGGSGKSTTALASLDSVLRYAGDDYCLVKLQAGQDPQLHSLYNTAKVKGSSDFIRFPWMAGQISNAERIGEDGEKPMMFVQEHRPDKLIAEFPLKAIVLPRFIPDLAEPKVIRVAPTSALKALAESTIMQLTGTSGDALRGMSALVRQTPCYLVGVTADLSLIPSLLLNLLAEHT